MVAVAPRPPIRRADRGWILAAIGLGVLGLGLRWMLGGGGIGELGALVLMVLLGLGLWLATWLAGGGVRLALAVVAGAMGLLVLGGLPPRDAPEYDEREAYFRPDQAIQVRAPAGPADADVLVLVAEPVVRGATPRFGLAGTLNGRALQWSCAFRSGGAGPRAIGLELPAGLGPAGVTGELRLTGEPGREGDYLVVYETGGRGAVASLRAGVGVECGLR